MKNLTAGTDQTDRTATTATSERIMETAIIHRFVKKDRWGRAVTPNGETIRFKQCDCRHVKLEGNKPAFSSINNQTWPKIEGSSQRARGETIVFLRELRRNGPTCAEVWAYQRDWEAAEARAGTVTATASTGPSAAEPRRKDELDRKPGPARMAPPELEQPIQAEQQADTGPLKIEITEEEAAQIVNSAGSNNRKHQKVAAGVYQAFR